MELDKKIGEKLKQLRLRHKELSTREVGRRIGVSNSYISKIENGTIPSLAILQKLCDLYEITMPELFGEEKEVPNELKALGVGWISFAKEMEKEDLTPEEVKKYIQAVKLLKGL